MNNVIGYLFIIVLMLLLGAFFAISMMCDYKRIKKRAEREIKKLEILQQLITLKEQITATSAKHLRKNSFEYLYLSQIDAALQDNPFQLDKKRVTPLNFKKSEDGIDKEAFLRGYQKAHTNVKKDMDALSDILGNIYQMQHPTKYKMMQLKKIMVLQVLKILIVFCSFRIKRLEKRCENDAKKRIKELKQQQKQAQNRPSSVLLNINSDECNGLLGAI